MRGAQGKLCDLVEVRRRHPQVFAFLSTPVNTPALSPYPHLVPILPSLSFCNIDLQGAAKLAAVLSQTKITNLECAAPRTRPTMLSAPIGTPLPALARKRTRPFPIPIHTMLPYTVRRVDRGHVLLLGGWITRIPTLAPLRPPRVAACRALASATVRAPNPLATRPKRPSKKPRGPAASE